MLRSTPLYSFSKYCSLRLAFSGALTSTLCGTALLSTTGYAQATVAEYDFAISSGTLDDVLAEYSRVTRVTLSFEPAAAEGKRSPGVSGRYTAATAMNQLLRGSGMRAVQSAQNSYTLLPVDPASLQLAPTDVNATTSALEAVTEGTGSYTTGQVSIGKSPLSIKDTPQTVSVISQQRIQDQQLTTLGKALQQTTGITEYQGSMTSARYLSRGFEITNFRVDGGSALVNAAWMDMDTAIFDHVEVLRGADGLFAGDGEPGGTVNLVRKRPTAEPKGSVTVSAGSWDNYRQELDVSGPLAFQGRLRGRLVAVNQTRNSFIDYAGSDRGLYYGVLEADLDDVTTLFGGITHDRLRSSDQAYGLPRYSTGEDLKLPRDFYLSGIDDKRNLTNDTYFLRADRQLAPGWTLSVDSQYSRQREFRDYYNFAGSVDPDTGAGIYGEGGLQYFPKTEKSVDVALKGTFELFGLEHGVTAGWSWMDRDGKASLYSSGTYAVDNIFSFDPHDYPANKSRSVKNANLSQHVRKDGVYGALRLQLAEPLHWFIGGSLNNYRYSYDYDDLLLGTSSPVQYEDTHVFLPYTGLMYDLTSEWSVYTSVAEIYKSQADRLKGPAPGTSALDPITGRNYELGIKGELFGGRLNTYAALYYTKRDGEAVRDTQYPYTPNEQTGASCCYLGDGRVVSKGLDIEISGELAKGLEATFGYTYNHNEDKVSGAAYSSLTPRHLAKLFATYQLPGPFSRLKLGGGVTAQTASYVSGSAAARDADGKPTGQSVNYRFNQTGYALWNAFAHYTIDEHWSVSANLDNIFDKKYYSTVGYSDYANFYGTPRSYTMTLRADF